MLYRYITGIAVISLVCFAFYFRLASYELLNINEGLYAEIAREMLVTHDYVLPQLNFILYIEKPPLLYWLIAGSFKLFGTDVFAARFVTTTSGVVTCLALIGFGFKMNQMRLGYLGAIIVATSLGFQIIMRMVFFDPLLTACFTLALLSFYIWYEKSEIFYLRCFYVLLALAVLTKGFVGLVLPGAIVVFFMLTTRAPLAQWKTLFDVRGIALFFLVVLPWHIVMAFQHDNFLWRYLVEEQFLRFLNEREPRDYHTGPIYYYLPRIVAYLLPWSFLLPLLFYRIHDEKSSESKKLSLFLWFWFLVLLIFFSISKAKGDYYMVLGVPPLALLLALQILEEGRGKVLKVLVIMCWLLCLVGLSLAPDFIPAKHAIALAPLTTLAKVFFWSILIAGIAVFFYKNKKVTHYKYLVLLMVIFFSMIYLFTSVKILLQDNGSEIKIGNYINTYLKGQKIYLYEDFEEYSTILFYVRQRMPIINSRSADLAYGRQFAPKEWFVSDAEFRNLATHKSMYVMVLKDKLSQLPKNFHVLVESSSAALVTNR